MYPIIFKISFVEARSYYLLWASALLIFVFWTRRRAERIWGMDDDAVTSVLLWVYCAGILGSFAAGVAEKLPLYFSGELTLKMTLRGLSSGGGMLAGGLVGVWRLWKYKINIEDFAEAAAIPSATLLGVGRIGCLMEGCCEGIGKYYSDAPWWAVHLHYDPAGFYRYPSQLSESLASFGILLLLLSVERVAGRIRGERSFAVTFPLFMTLYGFYRLIFDSFREPSAGASGSGELIWLFAVAFGLLWLAFSVMRLLKTRCR
ncbi:MAG: prolipoprotein diacylglyceryl transferase [Synergistaceae bacterium]|nr:prolipoprotein diacylglyceryl transferase [Synergistaceae bacterium]